MFDRIKTVLDRGLIFSSALIWGNLFGLWREVIGGGYVFPPSIVSLAVVFSWWWP
jgi:hypothetical protein